MDRRSNHKFTPIPEEAVSSIHKNERFSHNGSVARSGSFSSVSSSSSTTANGFSSAGNISPPYHPTHYFSNQAAAHNVNQSAAAAQAALASHQRRRSASLPQGNQQSSSLAVAAGAAVVRHTNETKESSASKVNKLFRPKAKDGPTAGPNRTLKSKDSKGDLVSTAPPEKSHKHQLFRSRKDVHPGLVLSSSASNSKPSSIDGSSLYSFGLNSPSTASFAGAMSKSSSSLDLKGVASRDERLEVYEDVWPLLRARILPLFGGENLRPCIEDLNRLVMVYLKSAIKDVPQRILYDLRDLLDAGTRNMENNIGRLSNARLITRLLDIWQFFYCTAMPYFEGIFLPLQQEFKGVGIMSKQKAASYWSGVHERLDMRRMCLMAFRDNILLPLHDQLQGKFSE